ncbi:MAG: twin-arginine translocation signal domain-containing protein [Thermoguttaceae bacterium]
MNEELSRRRFLKDTALLAGAMAVMQSVDRATAGAVTSSAMPTIRLGHVEISRLILGSNPFFGYAHQDGDLGRQMQEYYTDERIMEVLEDAAALGVTAVAAPPSPEWIRLFNKYRGEGGKLTTWIAQPHGSPKKMKEEIDSCAKGGAKAVFIQGHRVEEQFEKNTFEIVRGWLQHIKSHGMAAGIAAHRPDVHPVAEKQGFPTDFYFQCFFRVDQHPENYALECRDKAVETIRSITAKPVVAYKILGAARLPPDEGFAYAFQHIAAKDGVCVGIYNKNKPGMLADDVALVRRATKS